jgi:hypothetical protein
MRGLLGQAELAVRTPGLSLFAERSSEFRLEG